MSLVKFRSKDGLYLLCPHRGCQYRTRVDATTQFTNHTDNCRMGTAETAKIERSLQRMRDTMPVIIVDEQDTAISAVAYQAVSVRGGFYSMTVLNPYRGVSTGGFQVREYATLVERVDAMVLTEIELAFDIEHDVVRFFLKPAKKDEGHGDALRIVLNDLINREELPEFSNFEFMKYSNGTKKYRPPDADEAAQIVKLHTLHPLRVNAQTLAKSFLDENDHRLMELLEKIVARLFRTSVQSIQAYIMRQGPPAVEFSSISPVSSMLAVAFWIKSDRFLLDGNLRKYKKEKLWIVWRTSIQYRQHGDLRRFVTERSVQAINAMNREGFEVQLLFNLTDPEIKAALNEPSDGSSKSEVKRLLQTWIERVRPDTTFLTVRELLAMTAKSMTDRARIAERQNKIHGGDWTAPSLLRSIARAFIKLKLDLLVINQQGKRPSGEDGEKFASAEICKRFSACAIKAGLRTYGVAIKQYIDALRQYPFGTDPDYLSDLEAEGLRGDYENDDDIDNSVE